MGLYRRKRWCYSLVLSVYLSVSLAQAMSARCSTRFDADGDDGNGKMEMATTALSTPVLSLPFTSDSSCLSVSRFPVSLINHRCGRWLPSCDSTTRLSFRSTCIATSPAVEPAMSACVCLCHSSSLSVFACFYTLIAGDCKRATEKWARKGHRRRLVLLCGGRAVVSRGLVWAMAGPRSESEAQEAREAAPSSSQRTCRFSHTWPLPPNFGLGIAKPQAHCV